MSRSCILKRTLAVAVSLMMTSAAFTGSGSKFDTANADEDSYYGTDNTQTENNETLTNDNYTDNSNDTAVTDQNTADSNYDAGAVQESQPETSSNQQLGPLTNGMNLTEYTDKLKEIDEKQKQLDSSITEADDKIKEKEKEEKSLQKKIDVLDDKIEVLNSYLTALELQITTNNRETEKKQTEIEANINGFKNRLRTMYLAGSSTYSTMLMESDSFYDILMRMELIERVAKHDNAIIDTLMKSKAELEKEHQKLEESKKEYDKQMAEYDKEKAKLDKLYNSTEKTKKELEKKKKKMLKESDAIGDERSMKEADLAGIMKSSMGGTTERDEEVRATMALADMRLRDLRKAISERLKNGERIDPYECQYDFGWPVPGVYNITSGVGSRWGSYHAGIDIMGEHGDEIHASESGVVLRTNTVCPHDYGKNGSCGCGGGYGKFVVIDHGNDFITLYGHMSEVLVEPGDRIKKGQLIGKMGSTGFSTGDHLHFELRYQGYITNPVMYVTLM